jgi:hypothetical protein
VFSTKGDEKTQFLNKLVQLYYTDIFMKHNLEKKDGESVIAGLTTMAYKKTKNEHLIRENARSKDDKKR